MATLKSIAKSLNLNTFELKVKFETKRSSRLPISYPIRESPPPPLPRPRLLEISLPISDIPTSIRRPNSLVFTFTKLHGPRHIPRHIPRLIHICTPSCPLPRCILEEFLFRLPHRLFRILTRFKNFLFPPQ